MTAAAGTRFTDEQRLAWLRLTRTENVGPATFRSLINSFGSAQSALAALPELSRRGGARRSVRIPTEAEVASELERATKLGARFVALGEPEYPPWLRHGDGPPPVLSILGSPDFLLRPSVAIVGARNASAAGRKMAAILARDLGTNGFTIVSGLARGIDSAAHEASRQTGTVAVFAGGLDHIYPPENGTLLAEILGAGGCAVSEMPLGWQPRARDFPRRNRIIAGMTLATVVVEAAERSGSLITARLALEQNREVMAVPGSPLDPRCSGSNRLLKQGARPVTEAADVIEGVRPMIEEPPAAWDSLELKEREPEAGDGMPAESERDRVIEALGPTPVAIDDIIRFAGLSARVVQIVLLELELAGRIERHPGQRVSIR